MGSKPKTQLQSSKTLFFKAIVQNMLQGHRVFENYPQGGVKRMSCDMK